VRIAGLSTVRIWLPEQHRSLSPLRSELCCPQHCRRRLDRRVKIDSVSKWQEQEEQKRTDAEWDGSGPAL